MQAASSRSNDDLAGDKEGGGAGTLGRADPGRTTRAPVRAGVARARRGSRARRPRTRAVSALSRPRVALERQSWRLVRLRGQAPRHVFLALVAVLALIGLRELVLPEAVPAPPPVPRVLVDHAQQSFAVDFVRAYLSYDPNDLAAQREALAGFTPSELDDDAGFTPPDTTEPQDVVWAEAVQDQEALAGGRIVTVAAQTTAYDGPLYLAVPVRRDGTGMISLAGYPSFVGAPASTTEVSLPEREEVKEPELAAVARRVVANYLVRDKRNLNADLSPEAVVTLPPVPLTVRKAREVVWAGGPGGEGVLVTVSAEDEQGGVYTLTYELGVEQVDNRWRVYAVEVAPEQT